MYMYLFFQQFASCKMLVTIVLKQLNKLQNSSGLRKETLVVREGLLYN